MCGANGFAMGIGRRKGGGVRGAVEAGFCMAAVAGSTIVGMGSGGGG